MKNDLLVNENRDLLTTTEAAPLLRLSKGTLRTWAKDGSGPIQPLRFNKRKLMWRVCDIRKLVAGE